MAAVSGPQPARALTPPRGLRAGGEQDWKPTVSLNSEVRFLPLVRLK